MLKEGNKRLSRKRAARIYDSLSLKGPGLSQNDHVITETGRWERKKKKGGRCNEDLRADRQVVYKGNAIKRLIVTHGNSELRQSARVEGQVVKTNDRTKMLFTHSPNSFFTMDIWSVEMKLESLSTLGVYT